MSVVSISELHHRVRLEKPETGPDGGGGETVTWTPVATVWAKVEPIARSEESQAGARVSPQEYRVTLRHRDDITPNWRLVFRGGALAIRGLWPDASLNRYLILRCETGSGI